MASNKAYYVYIITNFQKTILYTGVTNNLEQRIIEHYLGKGNTISFTGSYPAFYLLYKCSPYILNSIAREKEIKGWKRSKKEKLIKEFNPAMKFLNEELFGQWPPKEQFDKRK